MLFPMSKTTVTVCLFIAGLLLAFVGLYYTFEALWTGHAFLPRRGSGRYYSFNSSPLYYVTLMFWLVISVCGLALMRFSQLAWKFRTK